MKKAGWAVPTDPVDGTAGCVPCVWPAANPLRAKSKDLFLGLYYIHA